MTTVAQAKLYLLVKRAIQVLFLIGFVALVVFLSGPKFGAIVQALTPPDLPRAPIAKVPEKFDQGWSDYDSAKYHSIGQGTRTFPVPLSWLMALEQPKSSLWRLPFRRADRFLADDYILRFGFIKSPESEHNPLGLPLGFAVTPMQNLPGMSFVEDAVGFNCAACHTGQMTVGDNHFLIEGGAAAIDLSLLTEAISAALGQTLVSSRIPVLNGRFERFAEGVLQEQYSDAGVLKLKANLESLVKHLKNVPSSVDVVEGYARLDALNRIGNQSFAIDFHRPENYVPPNAPVNYPHIWTAPWFDWVQYDGSIMNPLVRNAGEALGVSAYVNFSAPKDEGRFSSSINYENLEWIENTLAGSSPLDEDGKFNEFSGLTGPKWQSEVFGEIDPVKAEVGGRLYTRHCQLCHLRTPSDPKFGVHFSKVKYRKDGKEEVSVDEMLRITTVPLEVIGTDPAQAEVLVNRRVDTASNKNTSSEGASTAMGLDTAICMPFPKETSNDDEGPVVVTAGGATSVGESVYKKSDLLYQYKDEQYQHVRVKDSPNGSFAHALGALVQESNDRWFADNPVVSEEERRVKYEKGMPNCLRAGEGYKARPLDGVWATAPFLHNGSVPTIYDLLSSPEERPEFVKLGGVEFDPERLGLVQQESVLEKAEKIFGGHGINYCKVQYGTESGQTSVRRTENQSDSRYIDGYFILDTSIPGNCNTGHEFSDRYIESKELGEQAQGVIGPKLSKEERDAIIEFLKTQ